MTALSNAQTIPTNPRARNVYNLQTSTAFYAGALIGLSAAGFAKPWNNDAANVFLGIGLTTVNTTAGDSVVAVNEDGVIVKNIAIASAVQASVGLEVYCTTDNIFDNCTLDGGSIARAIGRIIRFRSASDCDVELYTPAEWMARYIQATT